VARPEISQVRNYKELLVWQKAVALSLEVYKATGHFPDAEKFGLTSQIRRAAASVPANIAEGWGRGMTKEYVQFLRIARGSLMELETHCIIAQGLGYFSAEKIRALQTSVEGIGKMLNALIQSLLSR
jgi:four helix bundle protein